MKTILDLELEEPTNYDITLNNHEIEMENNLYHFEKISFYKTINQFDDIDILFLNYFDCAILKGENWIELKENDNHILNLLTIELIKLIEKGDL